MPLWFKAYLENLPSDMLKQFFEWSLIAYIEDEMDTVVLEEIERRKRLGIY